MPSKSKLLGPDFEDFTITSENLRWLHSCRWEASHVLAFQDLRVSHSNSFGKVPNLVKSKTHLSPNVSARWLLIDEDETPHAWAELQSFPTQRDKWGIIIWGSVPDMTPDPLSLTKLVSYCFIVGRFDHLTIGASKLGEQGILQGFAKSVGEKRQAFAVGPKPWFPGSVGLIPVMTLEVAREEWMTSSMSEDPSKMLEMIRARIMRFEKSQNFLTQKRKKRGLMARLFNPKLEDPLF